MNRFFLIPATTITMEDGNSSTFPSYLRSIRNPSGYDCRFAAARYGRRDLWLVRVMELSEADGAALAGQADVYAFPLDGGLNTAISDKSRIDAYFESFRVPTDWTTPSTTYLELARALVHMAEILQRYYGRQIEAGATPVELFREGVTLGTRFRDLTAQEQAWLRGAVNELAGVNVPINQNNTLRQLIKAGSNYLMTRAVTLGDMTL